MKTTGEMTWNELIRWTYGAENITVVEQCVPEEYKFYNQESSKMKTIGFGGGIYGVNWWAYDYYGSVIVVLQRGSAPGAVPFGELLDDLPAGFFEAPKSLDDFKTYRDSNGFISKTYKVKHYGDEYSIVYHNFNSLNEREYFENQNVNPETVFDWYIMGPGTGLLDDEEIKIVLDSGTGDDIEEGLTRLFEIIEEYSKE